MPLSANGLCDARDHGAGDVGVGAHPGDRRRRRDAEQQRVDAGRGDAGDEGGLEQRARAAGVAADDEGAGRAEHVGGGPPEGEGQLRRELGVGDAADAVGAEPHGRRRLPLASTAVPCGPS